MLQYQDQSWQVVFLCVFFLAKNCWQRTSLTINLTTCCSFYLFFMDVFLQCSFLTVVWNVQCWQCHAAVWWPFHGSRWKLKEEDVDSLTRASHKDLRALARSDKTVARCRQMLLLKPSLKPKHCSSFELCCCPNKLREHAMLRKTREHNIHIYIILYSITRISY